MTTPRFLLALALATPGPAHAEGWQELGAQSQVLDHETVLYVDVLDPTVETFVFSGVGSVTVTDPVGTVIGSFGTGEPISPTPGLDGAYKLVLNADQTEEWDISVLGVESPGGRLHSPNWFFFTDSYGEEDAFTGSFYALVAGGGEGYTAVVELRTDGLAGREWSMAANSRGVNGPDAGRSLPMLGNSFTEEYPIYINPPAKAAYDVAMPAVGQLDLSGGVTGCDAVAPGHTTASFSFDSNVVGTYHLVCDLNDDGIYDVAGDDDLSLSGSAEIGTNYVEWDGTDNGGEPVRPGAFDCQVTLTVGEFHYIAADVETSFLGLRLFQVLADGARAPLDMYWNDTAVEYAGETMPNGEAPLVTSGADGVSSGDYDDVAVPNANARSWGNFTVVGESAPSKGESSYLDTFAWLEETASASLVVQVFESDADTDGDGFTDIEELCDQGTDPNALAGYYHGGCAALPVGPAALGALLAAAAVGARRRRS